MTDACPFAGHERQKSEILSQTSNVQVNQTLPYPKLRPLLFWDCTVLNVLNSQKIVHVQQQSYSLIFPNFKLRLCPLSNSVCFCNAIQPDYICTSSIQRQKIVRKVGSGLVWI